MLGALYGLASLLGSIELDNFKARRNWKYRQKEMALQQDYNERNMALQYEYAMRAFNEQNAYNNPLAAVTRWRQAGISPAAVYSGSPGGAGVAGSLATPDSDNPNSGSNMGPSDSSASDIIQAFRLAQEAKLVDSQVKLNEANAAKARGDTKDSNEVIRNQKLTNNLLEMQVIGQDVANKQNQLDLDRDKILFDISVEIDKAKLDNIKKQNNLLNQQIAESASRVDLNRQSIIESTSRIVLNMAETALAQTRAKWEGKVSEAQIKRLGAEVDNLMSNVDLNNAKKFLTSCQSLSEVEKYQGLVLDNWNKQLSKTMDMWKYSVDDDANPTDGGSSSNIWHLLESVANMLHLGANISKSSK